MAGEKGDRLWRSSQMARLVTVSNSVLAFFIKQTRQAAFFDERYRVGRRVEEHASPLVRRKNTGCSRGLIRGLIKFIEIARSHAAVETRYKQIKCSRVVSREISGHASQPGWKPGIHASSNFTTRILNESKAPLRVNSS